ncbi:MAG: RHS repeat-associated core domain-containing protein, partial [Armatimonadota bacterium]
LERDPAGATLRRYAYGSELLSMQTAGQERYFHTDALGSILNTSNATGTLETSLSYEPFGALRRQNRHSATAADNPIRFTGAYHDPTGLYHLRARQYDPASGRFTATDALSPLLVEPYASSYVYAENLPNALVDPSGMGAVRADAGRVAPQCGPATPVCISVAIRVGLPALAALARAVRPGASAGAAIARAAAAAKAGTVMTYRAAQATTRGAKGDYQAHHLVEVRHLRRWGYDVRSAPAVVLSRAEHMMLTQHLRVVLPYGAAYGKQAVWRALSEIYANRPAWLTAIRVYFG